MKTLLYLFIFLLLGTVSCSKGKDEKTNNPVSIIKSFSSTRDTIEAWTDTAYLKIVASGSGIQHEWKANHGTLKAFGDSAVYYAGQCCIGNNTITCKVTSDGGTDSRDLKIVVTPYLPKK